MNITKFRNPWYTRQLFQPEYYFVKGHERPINYKDYYIFTHTNPWVDVVKYDYIAAEHVCVTQRVTVTNAKQFIDSLENHNEIH